MGLEPRLRYPTGRRKPYTETGLLRMACWRCGQRAAFQWRYRSCADAQAGGLSFDHYRPLCVPCDIACNRQVLEFYREPGLDEIIAAYTLQAWQAVHDDTEGAYCAEVSGCPHHKNVRSCAGVTPNMRAMREYSRMLVIVLLLLALIVLGVGLTVEALRWLLIIALVLVIASALSGRRL